MREFPISLLPVREIFSFLMSEGFIMSIAIELIEEEADAYAAKHLARYRAFNTSTLTPEQRGEFNETYYGLLQYKNNPEHRALVIRRERQRKNRHAKFGHDPKVAAIHRLRVNIKSLAAEAKIIRHEESRAGFDYYFELNHHRRGNLRYEARLAHLALGFIRGRKRSYVENNAEYMTGLETGIFVTDLLAKIGRFHKVPGGLSRDMMFEWLRS